MTNGGFTQSFRRCFINLIKINLKFLSFYDIIGYINLIPYSRTNGG
jgi:hypothetical protein